MSRSLAAIAMASLCAFPGACKRAEPIPTQQRLVAKALAAPGIDELRPHKTANRTIRQGEVYRLVRSIPEFEWQGMFDGQVLQRKGAVEVRGAELDGPTFVFASDFIEAAIPTADWICARMGEPSVFNLPCARVLRSIVAQNGRLISYAACAQSSCPLAELNAGRVTTTTVPGLSEVRVVSFGSQQRVLAWSRWMREPAWTGGTVLVLQLAPPLAKAGEVLLDEADARDPAKVVNRLGTLELLADGLRFTGTRTVRALQTGTVVSSEPVDERYGIAADGVLTRK